MPVRLAIELEGPFSEADADILTGLAMTIVTLAQKVSVQVEEPEPQPCGDKESFEEPSGPDYTGRVCVSPVGHTGRHKYRDPLQRVN